MKRKYVVTGATGNTGSIVASALLKAGEDVTVIGRSAEKLAHYEKDGATIKVGNIEDENFLTEAFKGADGLYLMIPPQYGHDDQRGYYEHVGNIYLEAAKKAGVHNVVFLSSIGVHNLESPSIVQGLAYIERNWRNDNSMNALFLRPTYFMENIFMQIGTIKQLGFAGSPFEGDKKFPVVSVKDIGKVAAERLLSLDFKGISHEYILGPEDISYNDITAAIGKELSQPDLKYVTFPYDQAEGAMQQMGLSSDAAKRMVQLTKDMNSGVAFSDAQRTKENTTTTTINEVAKTFAYAFNAETSN